MGCVEGPQSCRVSRHFSKVMPAVELDLIIFKGWIYVAWSEKC